MTRAEVFFADFVAEHYWSFLVVTTSPILPLVGFRMARLLPNIVQHAPKQHSERSTSCDEGIDNDN